MTTLNIDSYQVSIKQNGSNIYHTVLLKCTDGNTQVRVWLYFEGVNSTMISGRFNGIVHPVRSRQRRINVQMNEELFPLIYDILKTEAPVFFLYESRDIANNPSSERKSLTNPQIGTLDEIIGEGNSDEDKDD